MRTESNLVAHARRELAALGMTPTPPLSWLDRQLVRLRLKRKPDFEYDGAIAAAALELVAVFARQDHSGWSATCTAKLAADLFGYKPLSPLTGEDSEWVEVGEGVYQNSRCSHVFKENGEAYDIDGKVFEDTNGLRYTSRDSRVPVAFPYTPVTKIVKVKP